MKRIALTLFICSVIGLTAANAQSNTGNKPVSKSPAEIKKEKIEVPQQGTQSPPIKVEPTATNKPAPKPLPPTKPTPAQTGKEDIKKGKGHKKHDHHKHHEHHDHGKHHGHNHEHHKKHKKNKKPKPAHHVK